MKKILSITIIVLLLYPIVSSAETFTFNPTKDTLIDIVNPTSNFGSNASVTVGPTPQCRKLLFTFDISTVSGKIENAQLTFYHTFPSSMLTFWKLKRNDWAETSATWAIYKAATPWQSSGANGSNDYNSNITNFGGIGSQLSTIVFVKDLVQDAINSNSGIVNILTQCGVRPSNTYYFREASSALKPTLVVSTYFNVYPSRIIGGYVEE